MAAIWGYTEKLRILCTRELQVSIKDSMHAELKNAIASQPWLHAHYEVGEAFIRGKNGTEFIFKGLRHNISSIKSMAKIDLCIVEEAADVPKESWQALLPTIREKKSEIWAIYNPQSPSDPVDHMFRQNPPPRCMAVELSYKDNPWFPPELDEQRQHDREVMSPADYAWIWEGAYLTNSDAQVFANKFEIMSFEPSEAWSGPYYGLDFGFAADPTAAVKCWIGEDCLWIEQEAGKARLELDQTAIFLMERMRDIDKYVIRADSARPESISYLRRNGLPNMQPVKKWAGSVEDGIAYIKSFRKVVIHPRCEETIKEFSVYSYKIDRYSGDIMPQVIDANNHYIDCIRYALAPMISKKGKPGIRAL